MCAVMDSSQLCEMPVFLFSAWLFSWLLRNFLQWLCVSIVATLFCNSFLQLA